MPDRLMTSSLRALLAIPLAIIFLFSRGGCAERGASPVVAWVGRAAASFYIDCSSATNGSVTEASPWNTLASAKTTFMPGDRLFLKRGTACKGTLVPLGSGTSGAPIVVDAYGSGAAPILNGGTAEEVVKLFNQQYWEINNLEIVGGNKYGIFVSGEKPNSSLNHIYLKSLNVHGAKFASKKRADSGEVFLSTSGSGETFTDILIDGVTAHDTHAAEGIFISAGGAWTYDD